jgi:hypothetical protein
MARPRPLTEDQYMQDPLQRNDELEPVSKEVNKAVEALRQQIFKFKKQLFLDIVSNDKAHVAKDLGAMTSFHALFLQAVSYWIGLLDTNPVPPPQFQQQRNIDEFDALSKGIQYIQGLNSDAKTLVYSMLLQFSIQHPFDLGAPRRFQTPN